MNAEQEQSDGGLALPGAQLKAQREAMGWSIDQVAEQLKLAPRQVIALEAGDAAALPNLAVVRGFIRAYAKVLKLDATPLVAMVDLNPGAGPEAAPVRREISASFSEARFPSLTQRSPRPTGLIAGAVLALLVAAFGAWQMGLIAPGLLSRADKSPAPAATAGASAPAPAVPPPAAPEAGPASPSQDAAPVQTPSVPLISVPPPAGSAPEPAPAGTVPATPAAPAAPATPAAAPAPAASNALVLSAREDSWIELRRNGAAPLASRMLKAGSSETFDITEPVLLVVGRPAGVDATLRGEPLKLAPAGAGTTARLNIK